MNRATKKDFNLLIKLREKCFSIISQIVQILKHKVNIDNGIFDYLKEKTKTLSTNKLI